MRIFWKNVCKYVSLKTIINGISGTVKKILDWLKISKVIEKFMNAIVNPIKNLINKLVEKIVGVVDIDLPSANDLNKIVGIVDKFESLKKEFSENQVKKAVQNRL